MDPFANEPESAYLSLVRDEYRRLVDSGKDHRAAKAAALVKISRERRDLLEAHLALVAQTVESKRRTIPGRRAAAVTS